jgi:hypothetical protein
MVTNSTKERRWAPGKHGAEYNLKGSEGGLDWDRIRAEYLEVVTPEELRVGAEQCKRIAKGQRYDNTALERSKTFQEPIKLEGITS